MSGRIRPEYARAGRTFVASSVMEARVSALERTVTQHDKRIGTLDRLQTTTEATDAAMQQDIGEAKEAAQHL